MTDYRRCVAEAHGDGDRRKTIGILLDLAFLAVREALDRAVVDSIGGAFSVIHSRRVG
jgi:hypothetical protein